MKTRSSVAGVLAALGISFTAAIALPLVNIFKELTTPELMIVRGGVTAIIVLVTLWQRVTKPSKRVIGFSLLFSMATLALYAGIRAWGASPTLVVLTLTPVVNIAAKLWRGQSVDNRVYACLLFLVIGVTVALNPWHASFDTDGLFLSVAATVLAGLGFEVLSTEKGIDPYNKSFWLAVVTIGLGTVTSFTSGHIPFMQETWSINRVLALIGFGATGGFLYYLANIIAFERLKTEVASTLAMAETPAVIVGAWLMLGEKLSVIQWIGVLLALGATFALGRTEIKEYQCNSTPIPKEFK